MSAYNYEHFDAYVESGEDEREFAAFPNVLHAGERAPDGELTTLGEERVRLSDLSDGPLAVLKLGFPEAPISWDLRVDEAEENERLRWHCVGGPLPWVATDIVFRLGGAPEGGTRVLFDHVGWKDAEEMVRIVTFGWVQMFLRLKAFAETGKPQPYFDF